MKRNLFLFTLAGIALAGCVNDEMADVASEKEKVKIAFESPLLYKNSTTRANYFGEIGNHQYTAGGTTYSYPREEDFTIFAVEHDTDFSGWDSSTKHEMDGRTVKWEYSLDGWVPRTDENGYYYWKEGVKMSFAASSPANLNVNGVNRTYGKNGVTISDFEVNADPANQYDLLFSAREINKTDEDMRHEASYYSGIPLKFYHALSSIRFSLSNTSSALVKLTGIKLVGVKYKGTFKENLEENAAGNYIIKENDNAEGNVAPKWEVVDDVTIEPYTAFTGNVEFPENPQYVSVLADTDTDDSSEQENCNQLLLLPQQLTNTAKIIVNYTVNDAPQEKIYEIDKLKIDPSKGDETVTEWKMGVRYVYRLVYSQETEDRDKIYFAPSSEDWIEHDAIVVPL